jgi:hypothetical protein
MRLPRLFISIAHMVSLHSMDGCLVTAGMLTFVGEHSTANTTAADLATCTAVVHMISAVLLP